MVVTVETAVGAALGTVTAQVYAMLLDEGLIPSLGVGEVHALAVSIDDWEVHEATGDSLQHITTDGVTTARVG